MLHQSGPLDGVLQLRRNTSVTPGSVQGNGPDLGKGCVTGSRRRPGTLGFAVGAVGAGQASRAATSAVAREPPCWAGVPSRVSSGSHGGQGSSHEVAGLVPRHAVPAILPPVLPDDEHGST